MPYSEDLAERVRNHLGPAPDIVEKKMFGGVAFMVNGHMTVGVEKDRLMVRLDPDDADTALAEKHVGPMDLTGRPMRGFLFVAAEGVKKKADLAKWVDRAAAFARGKKGK